MGAIFDLVIRGVCRSTLQDGHRSQENVVSHSPENRLTENRKGGRTGESERLRMSISQLGEPSLFFCEGSIKASGAFFFLFRGKTGIYFDGPQSREFQGLKRLEMNSS